MDQTASIRRELNKPPEDVDLGAIIPVLVPRAFSETGAWPGPIYELAAAGFDQTWAVLAPDDVVLYVSRTMEAFWDATPAMWKERAAQNLRKIAEAQPYSHDFRRDDGSPFMVVMLYPQGLGPARLLIPGLLEHVFPDGYQVAVPEMTCAAAFTLTPSKHEAEKIENLLQNCFYNGTEPVSLARVDPKLLWELVSEDRGA